MPEQDGRLTSVAQPPTPGGHTLVVGDHEDARPALVLWTPVDRRRCQHDRAITTGPRSRRSGACWPSGLQRDEAPLHGSPAPTSGSSRRCRARWRVELPSPPPIALSARPIAAGSRRGSRSA
jgi:hypothetical protein